MVHVPEAAGRAVDGRIEADALRLHVTGVVQGVGFRPFVHRLALRHGLAGWIRNRAGEVEIEVEGSALALDQFVIELEAGAPPLARIDGLARERSVAEGHAQFRILESVDDPDGRQPVSPDVALCAACEAEMRDPSNRRYRYPFITCTDCGPRYTVIAAMPYDRERTSMRAFTQCAACLCEYNTPGDRRYHSETNSCPVCGPQLRWVDTRVGGGAVSAQPGGEIEAAAWALAHGDIVAIRGLGGFHLAVDATDEGAVRELRRRKQREAKPLAVMVRNVAEARQLGIVGMDEETLLRSAERPIVLLERRHGSRLAPAVTEGLDTVGVMLPYTPLHHLLLDALRRPLVMTSGNRSEEPIAIGNDEALRRLTGIADAFLLHDREIVSRYDDSVVRVVDGAPVVLRRARGYAPLPVPLPEPAPVPLLAVGPHLKNTFTLAHGREAWVSQHIGDLENLETLEHFRAALDAYRRLFRVEPERVVCDLHPGYLSSRVAEELGLGAPLTVQHHHAHIVAVAAEHRVREPVIGLAFDGTGLGEDGYIWGAEFLLSDAGSYRRLAHLRYAPMPGGDIAMRSPWRVALGYLSLEPSARPAFQHAFASVAARDRTIAEQQIERRINSPLASSMGRLFDAAAAVLGVATESRFEGDAAMRLESLAGRRAADPLPFPIERSGDGWRLDPLPLLVALGERRSQGYGLPDLAAAFHESVAAAATSLARAIRAATGVHTVALGGGVFQNARLLHTTRTSLEPWGFRVLTPLHLPPNDGAISYGQAVVAIARLNGY